MKKFKRYSVLKAVSFSIIYLLFFSWLELWKFLPGVLFIIDGYLIHLIPWAKFKKIRIKNRKLRVSLEWSFFIILAFIITLAIRTLFIEAYKIPTPSMEQTLMVGDYLFVSKLAYGPKLPNTPLAAPFMPGLLPNGRKSYSESLKLPYKRLKGFSKVKHNDVIVFNFPEGDTVVAEYSGQNYYSLKRKYGEDYLKTNYNLIYHPVDMRDNYIKRCLGLPGDTLIISNGKVSVNNVEIKEFEDQQFKYYLRTERHRLSDSILSILKINYDELNYNPTNSIHLLTLSNAEAKWLERMPEVKSIQRYKEPQISFRDTKAFPHSMLNRWTADNFGPVLIPKKGKNIEINAKNFPIYERIISVYEKNKTEKIDGEIYINNVLSRSYTFKMDYYFVLGDNRHNSADSRYWGFVPENHLVGKAILIWFSKDPEKNIFKGLRFDRMFKSIK